MLTGIYRTILCFFVIGLPSGAPLAQVSTSPSTPNVSQNSGRCDNACIRANADKAVQTCAPRIEAEAPGDYEWVTRPYGGIFQEAELPVPSEPNVVRYRGDSVRFFSPEEKWVRAIYECGFDAAKQQVAYVRVRLGVLGKKSAVPEVPPAARPQATAPNATGRTGQAAAASNPPGPVAATVNLRLIGEPSSVDVRQIPPGAKPTPSPGTP